jgi:hypothetical protein
MMQPVIGLDRKRIRLLDFHYFHQLRDKREPMPRVFTRDTGILYTV